MHITELIQFTPHKSDTNSGDKMMQNAHYRMHPKSDLDLDNKMMQAASAIQLATYGISFP
jgi:hypothetical protein